MLSAAQFDQLTVPTVNLYNDYIDSVLADIARRLSGMDMTSTAAWQTQRIIESGALYQDVITRLAILTGKSESVLRETFKIAGVKALEFDDRIYKAAGLSPLPLNLSPAMQAVLLAGLEKTGGIMRNLTMTTALTAQESFIKAADLAYLQVSQGAMSYDDAIRQAIKGVAGNGLQVIDYASGKRDQLDVAMRRTVLTGVGQTTGKLQEARADEMGQDLVETSAHVGARPSHQLWQGQVFSRSGADPKYPPFVESTGYGTGPGLQGWNCRHSFYPFFPGISERIYKDQELETMAGKTIKYNGQDISIYDATQVQREIERKIRYWKRQASTLEVGKQANTGELAKVAQYQKRMRDFITQMNKQDDFVWYRQRAREQISYGNILSVKSISTKNKIYNDDKPYFRYTQKDETPMSQWGHAMFADQKDKVFEHYSYGQVAWKFEPSKHPGANIFDKQKLRPVVEKELLQIKSSKGDKYSGLKDILNDDFYSLEQIVDSFFPSDIVTGAGSYDSKDAMELVFDLAKKHKIDAIITDDGAIVFNKKLITRAKSDDWILEDISISSKDVKKVEILADDLLNYNNFKNELIAKYGSEGDMWAKMTGAEADKMEKLEILAYRGR